MEQFQPSAQMLFLYYLYQKQNRVYMSHAVKALGFSAMTITRAARQLTQTGLFEVEKEGVKKVLIGKAPGKELFEKAAPYLINPVRKSIFVKNSGVLTGLYLAGITALSHRSMINSPNVACYAAVSNTSRNITGSEFLIDETEQVEIEIWRYDPGILSGETFVDPLSLILSLRGNRDERIEEAVVELLGEIWEE